MHLAKNLHLHSIIDNHLFNYGNKLVNDVDKLHVITIILIMNLNDYFDEYLN
jgi:hypothetical protein